jgi:hypothetical protein
VDVFGELMLRHVARARPLVAARLSTTARSTPLIDCSKVTVLADAYGGAGAFGAPGSFTQARVPVKQALPIACPAWQPRATS